MLSEILVVASTANERYAVGLGVMLCSVLQCTQRKNVRFYVLDDGITPETREFIENRVQERASIRQIKVEIAFIAISGFSQPGLTPVHGSTAAYGRLFLPYLLEESSVFYVDADILCNREFPLSHEIAEIHPGALIAGCLDPNQFLETDCPWAEKLKPEELKLPYINSGFMWMNLDGLRAFGLQEKFRELAEIGRPMPLADQTALNFLCRGKIAILPPDLNQIWNKSVFFIPRAHANLHYVGRAKPWLAAPSAQTLLKIDHFNIAARCFGFPQLLVSKARRKLISTLFYLKNWTKFLFYTLTKNPRREASHALLTQWGIISAYTANYAVELGDGSKTSGTER